MIVTNTETGWEIIFQPSHGLLAGQIADQLNEGFQTRFWFAARAAIAQHDDEQPDFSANNRIHLTKLGAPKDFTLVVMTAEERFRKNQRVIEQSYRKSRWMGLLESMHMEFLYKDEKVSKDLADLLKQERSHRRKVMRQLGIDKTDLKHAYQTLRWCDRCSLILCQNRLPAMQRRLEIITTSDQIRYEVWQREDQSVSVDPWPFGVEAFEVGVEVYTVEQLSFNDDRELGEKLSKTKPEYRAWQFCA